MEEALAGLRTELTGYCYRMLGSGGEAEDAVQETFERVLRAADRYDAARGSVRTWVYRIATNVCVDLLRGAARRALPIDLSAPGKAGEPFGELLPAGAEVRPVPDRLVLGLADDPAALVVRRESVRLAFVAALQHLPARQRSVLILRDVLCWPAADVAELLETSAASVTSALQRARATLRTVAPRPGDVLDPSDASQRELLTRYCAAFERHDVAGLVALLHEDATTSMPPFRWGLRGRDQIGLAMSAPEAACVGHRMVPVAASGQPAFWQLRPAGEGEQAVFWLPRDGSVPRMSRDGSEFPMVGDGRSGPGEGWDAPGEGWDVPGGAGSGPGGAAPGGDGVGYVPFALVMLDIAENRVINTTTWLELPMSSLWPLFSAF